MPLISIIVPVYKAEKFLNRCISSILKQDMDDFELLLIDDGSPDNSLNICKKWGKRDSRIIIFTKKMEVHQRQEILELPMQVESIIHLLILMTIFLQIICLIYCHYLNIQNIVLLLLVIGKWLKMEN